MDILKTLRDISNPLKSDYATKQLQLFINNKNKEECLLPSKELIQKEFIIPFRLILNNFFIKYNNFVQQLNVSEGKCVNYCYKGFIGGRVKLEIETHNKEIFSFGYYKSGFKSSNPVSLMNLFLTTYKNDGILFFYHAKVMAYASQLIQKI